MSHGRPSLISLPALISIGFLRVIIDDDDDVVTMETPDSQSSAGKTGDETPEISVPESRVLIIMTGKLTLI